MRYHFKPEENQATLFFDSIAFFTCFDMDLLFLNFRAKIFTMRLKFLFFILLALFLFIFPGCKMKNEPLINTSEILEEEPSTNVGKVKLIFYNMYLPTEMSRLFEKVGANYKPKILNPPDNFSSYSEKSKIALNIGIYGVDLSYSRIFSQNATTAKYFSSIHLMYEKLGIPDNYYEDLINGIEKYYNDKDSLAKFASDVYERADRYLRENKGDSYSALIVTGGWVEALYLAGKIAESNPDNIEIRERIAGQKYSLNSLISLLNNYQEDIVVSGYILMFKGLKKSFDKVDIYYDQKSFQLDTLNKLISTSDYNINLTPDIFEEITASVSEIRSDIVN
jgi:hypothetical protein